MKQNVELLINGQPYRIATEYDPEHMRRLGAILDEKLTSVLRGSRTRSLPQALILVSLDVIDEYVHLKDEWKQERAALRRAVADMTEDVDRTLSHLREGSGKA